MFCTKCGNEIPDDAKFCVLCGNPVIKADGGQLRVQNEAPSQPASSYQQSNTYQQPAQNFRQDGYIHEPYGAPATEVYQKPVYRQPEYVYAQSDQTVPAKRTTKWPASCGVFGVLFFLFFAASIIPMLIYYDEIGIGIGVYLGGRIIPLLMAIAVPILFFVHTKKLAFLTAIPMVIMLIMDIISLFSVMNFGYDMPVSYSIMQIVGTGLSFILVVFYVLQMIIRPAGAALPVLYLIFAIIAMLFSFVNIGVSLVGGLSMPAIGIANAIIALSFVFEKIAYIIAMFSSRKR